METLIEWWRAIRRAYVQMCEQIEVLALVARLAGEHGILRGTAAFATVLATGTALSGGIILFGFTGNF